MVRLNNKIKQKNYNKTNVGVDTHIDPLFEEITKNNKAITLITLIITIVVMLILAGVTIATFTGDDGSAMDSANTAVTKYNEKAGTTETTVNHVEKALDNYMKIYAPQG